MAMRADWIWMNGDLIPWDQANVHVFTHALHYGSSVFEGIRAYNTPKGPAIFRSHEHFRRLMDSAKIMRITPVPYSVDELIEAAKATIRANKQDSCYIRPLVYRGYESLGVEAWAWTGANARWKSSSALCPGAVIWAKKPSIRASMC